MATHQAAIDLLSHELWSWYPQSDPRYAG